MNLSKNNSKLKVVHLSGDANIGGVKRGIDSMANSILSNKCEFYTNYFNKVPINDPDLIIWHDAVGVKSLIKLILIRFKYFKSKVVVHEHHYSENYEYFNPFPNKFRFNLIAKLCFKLADLVVACSESNKMWMMRNKLAPNEKVFVIESYNSSINSLFNLNIPTFEKPLTFGFYGRTSRQKGIKILLDALDILSKIPNPGYEFVVQIKDTSDELNAKIKTLPDWIKIVKNIEVENFLSNIDILVVPSLWEPFGQVALEGKSAGKVVISSDVDGLVDQITSKEMLFRVNNSFNLASKILDVSNLSSKSLKEIAELNRQSVLEHYKKYIEGWSDVLSS